MENQQRKEPMNVYEMSAREIKEHLDGGGVLVCEGTQGGQSVKKRLVAYGGEEDVYLVLTDYSDNPYKHPAVAEGISGAMLMMEQAAPLEKWVAPE